MMAACIFEANPNSAANPYGPPVADWTHVPPTGSIYRPVSFYDQSTGNPTSWAWYLGGPSGTLFSIERYPNYLFDTPGNYPVTLVVTNSYGSDYHTDIVPVTS